MALRTLRDGVVDRQELARHYTRFSDDVGGVKAAAASETVIVLDQILAQLKLIAAHLAPLHRLNCPEFIQIPRYLRSIARDANRRNRRVDAQAKAKRRATRLATRLTKEKA